MILVITIDLKSNGSKQLSQEDKQRTQKNQERFGKFVYTVEELLEKYNEPKFLRCKYISSMSVSIYKSLQKLLVENLLRNEYYEKIY